VPHKIFMHGVEENNRREEVAVSKLSNSYSRKHFIFTILQRRNEHEIP
jgi:hypothetical protein